jgi:hypothetical protein
LIIVFLILLYYSFQDIQQETATQSSQNKIVTQEVELGSIPKSLNKTEESIITQKKEKKKILSLSKNHSKIERKAPLEQTSKHSEIEKKVLSEQTFNHSKIERKLPLEQTSNPFEIEKKSLLEQTLNHSKIKNNASLEQTSNPPTSDPIVSTTIKTTTLNLNNSRSLKLMQEEKGKQVETRRPLGDITKNSNNVPSFNDRAERKRKLLRKNPNDVPLKKQKN